MPSSFDLLAIGESLRDVFYLLDDASVTCTLQKEHCRLCLEYAEKIPVTHVIKTHAAGNAANAAVAGARLGLNVALLTWIGNDPEGEDLHAALRREGVSNKLIVIDKKHPTSEATVLSYQGEKTQLVHFQLRPYRLPPLPKAKAIYYSAMGHGFKTFDRSLLSALKKHPDRFFAFQPGTTHVRAGLDAVLPLVKRADLFIVNKEEAHQLLGDGNRTMMNLLETFMRYGAKRVIITDGKEGAFALDATGSWHMPALPITSKESTGAGDSFASTATIALFHGHDLPTALRWGAANAASVVQQVGPQAGLLTPIALQRLLKKYASFAPTPLA